ncbi:hypothetical protein [Kitasatospora sp. NPDC050463]|uniref:hypothetical protein n=1 Tax=Kitasatospora sp. NPDC050463 TaxID=3155786 RepID=UPI00340EEE9E
MGRGTWLGSGSGRHRKDSGARHRVGRWLGAEMLLGAGALAVPAIAATAPGVPVAYAAADGPVPARSHPGTVGSTPRPAPSHSATLPDCTCPRRQPTPPADDRPSSGETPAPQTPPADPGDSPQSDGSPTPEPGQDPTPTPDDPPAENGAGDSRAGSEDQDADDPADSNGSDETGSDSDTDDGGESSTADNGQENTTRGGDISGKDRPSHGETDGHAEDKPHEKKPGKADGQSGGTEGRNGKGDGEDEAADGNSTDAGTGEGQDGAAGGTDTAEDSGDTGTSDADPAPGDRGTGQDQDQPSGDSCSCAKTPGPKDDSKGNKAQEKKPQKAGPKDKGGDKSRKDKSKGKKSHPKANEKNTVRPKDGHQKKEETPRPPVQEQCPAQDDNLPGQVEPTDPDTATKPFVI